MGLEPMPFHLYGQPPGDYEIFFPTFAETLIKCPYRSGWKLHITVSTQHYVQLAGLILPRLRLLHTHHKMVLPGAYPAFNQGSQGGKFITVYAGPDGPAQRIINVIDPVLTRLRLSGIQPGPWPMNRQANHTVPEEAVGESVMISRLWLDNLLHG
jgi:hypothetical protein